MRFVPVCLLIHTLRALGDLLCQGSVEGNLRDYDGAMGAPRYLAGRYLVNQLYHIFYGKGSQGRSCLSWKRANSTFTPCSDLGPIIWLFLGVFILGWLFAKVWSLLDSLFYILTSYSETHSPGRGPVQHELPSSTSIGKIGRHPEHQVQ